MKGWTQWGYKTKLLYFSFQIKWGHVNIWFMNFTKSQSHLCSFSASNMLPYCSFANELFATELEETTFSQKTEGRPNDSCKQWVALQNTPARGESQCCIMGTLQTCLLLWSEIQSFQYWTASTPAIWYGGKHSIFKCYNKPVLFRTGRKGITSDFEGCLLHKHL